MREGNVISFTSVRLAHGWLGNMSPHAVEALSTTWPTCEHLFQALRFAGHKDVQEAIRVIKSPMGAKMHAKGMRDAMTVVPMGEQDLLNMRFVLRIKIEQHPTLSELLVLTKPCLLTEDVSKRARGSGLFWGMKRDLNDAIGWSGKNMLGKLWMELRNGVAQ